MIAHPGRTKWGRGLSRRFSTASRPGRSWPGPASNWASTSPSRASSPSSAPRSIRAIAADGAARPAAGGDGRALSWRRMPYRGKRNEPAYVVETNEVLASVKGVERRRHGRRRRRTTSSACSTRRVRAGCGAAPHERDLSRSWDAGLPAACRASAAAGARAIRPIRGTAAGAARCWSSGRAATASPPCLSTRRRTCASSLLGADVRRLDAVLYTHDHADHTHGIDDLRPLAIHMRRVLPVYMDEDDVQPRVTPVPLLLRIAAGKRLSADRASSTASCLGHDVRVDGAGGVVEATPIRVHHGRTATRSASASATWPIRLT